MAINIFQGATKATRSGINSAKASSRAENARKALTTVGEVSGSGATAVGRKGTLSKVGNFIGKTAGVVSKFAPGVAGTIAKGIAKIFNDPAWWQSVPGDAITLNTPLRTIEYDGGAVSKRGARFTMAEFYSTVIPSTGFNPVMTPSQDMISQYLMSEVRKVVNAIPLQKAESYATVIGNNATAYALWRTLLKFDYMLKHGQTYLPSFNDDSFPILKVENAATLQSYINRLEEYLRASVRLPHTLCEYLAWRFGRIYKSNNSAKSGLILYNVVSMATTMTKLDTLINAVLSANTATAELQQANADLYNTYYDHDQAVVIADATQFSFDCKEFMLRTNLDVGTKAGTSDNGSNIIQIDSDLDNPTTFMASTVSTLTGSLSGEADPTYGCLFPVAGGQAYIPADKFYGTLYFGGGTPQAASGFVTPKVNGGSFSAVPLTPVAGAASLENYQTVLAVLPAFKALDIYNKDIYIGFTATSGGTVSACYDVTALSIDAGQVTDLVLRNEQVYAFANLVHIDRKRSDTYAQAEKQVAKDTANLVETLDVATKA